MVYLTNFHFFVQGSTSLSAQQQQLQQLQLLQQQLIQHTQLMQQSSQGTPVIDSNLLSHIQTLTNQLLKSGDKPPEPGFNRVSPLTNQLLRSGDKPPEPGFNRVSKSTDQPAPQVWR
jgi:hypothetical protein